MRATTDDIALRNEVLWIDDPYVQPGLVLDLPDGAQLGEVRNVYEFGRYPQEKVYCAKCEAHRHKRGFTVELTDGHLVLLGSKCGAEVFGRAWQRAARAYHARRERQQLLFTLDALRDALPLVFEQLKAWREPCVALDAARREFVRQFPKLAAALEAQVGDGALVVRERVRDYAAEQKAGDNAKLFTWIERRIGTLEGGAALRSGFVEGRRDQARDNLAELSQACRANTTYTNQKMKALTRRTRDVRESLSLVLEMLNAGPALFSERNMRLVCLWASASDEVPGKYSLAGNEVHDDEGRTFVLPELRTVTSAPIDTLAATSEAWSARRAAAA